MNQEIDTLIQQCGSADSASNPLFDAPLFDMCARAGVSLERFYDIFAHRIATEFSAGRLTFDTADAAINLLHNYSLMGPSQELLDGFAWEIYRAFDAGEYMHPSERDTVDPVIKYTMPLVARALASGFPQHEV